MKTFPKRFPWPILLVCLAFPVGCPAPSESDIPSLSESELTVTPLFKAEEAAAFADLSLDTCSPVTATLTEEAWLQITSYLPLPLRRLCVSLRPKGSAGPGDPLVCIETLPPFSVTRCPLPPADTTDKEIGLDCADPLWQRLQTITRPLTVRFNTDSPEMCHAICLLGLSLAYLFNHPDYEAHLKNWNEGGWQGKNVITSTLFNSMTQSNPFKTDDGEPLSAETVLQQVRNKQELRFGVSEERGHAVLGGIDLAFQAQTYKNFGDYEALVKCPELPDPNSQFDTVETIFHEYAHCLGYRHDDPEHYPGTMTYGGGWTVCNYEFINTLIDRKDLLFPLSFSREKPL